VHVAAVVAQKSENVRRYFEQSPLALTVLVDESRDVLRAYGVWHRLGLDAWNVAKPAVFLIDRNGRIRYRFVAETQGEFPSHDELMAEIEKLGD
jgi:peroxiredoxin